MSISNSDDMIDSRDVIARIEELENHKWPPSSYEGELDALLALKEDAKGYGEDWEDGVMLIRDSYFKEYAQEFAEDIGAITMNLEWPARCIDWDEAARELQMDFTSVEFDGITYWMR